MPKRLLKPLLWGLAAALAVLVPPFPSQADDPAPTFRVGVAPHASARVILSMYQPLRESLRVSLGRPVEIVTAPDFVTYAQRALDRTYDITIVAGQQARMLQTDADYRPLVAYRSEFRIVAVAPTASDERGPEDFVGKSIVGLGATSMADMWGAEWLKTAGIDESGMPHVSAADNVARLVLNGNAAAGFMSRASYRALAPELRSGLRVLAESGPLLGRVYMLNARHEGEHATLMRALRTFAESEAGKAYFKEFHLDGYREIDPGELEAMEPYARRVRDSLKAVTK